MKRTSLVDTLANEFVYGQAQNQVQAQDFPIIAAANTEEQPEEQKVSLAKIQLSPLQYRRYIDPAKLTEITTSIKKYGQLQAILVRPVTSKSSTAEYELVFGQTRFLACREAGVNTVLAKVQTLTDAEVVELALIENNHRTNPNPVEETQGMLKLLSLKLNKAESEVIALLNRASTEEKQGSDNVIRSKDWQVVKSVFQLFSSLTPESFRVNRLPILNLPAEVLESLNQGKLEYTKARTIARIKDEPARKQLLQHAIKQDLSLSQIKERVLERKLEAKSAASQETELTLRDRLDSIYRQLKKSNIWDSPKKGKQLEKMISQIETLLKEE
jgi:ParB family transcriptional regulator, chromosome partitioning protein